MTIHSDPSEPLRSVKSLGSALDVINAGQGQDKNDVIFFPVIHGTGGEDGRLQGFLELGEKAFVGPDTLGSAMAIDKVVAKQRVKAAGVDIVPYRSIRYDEWLKSSKIFVEECLDSLGPRLFVKPATLGSSVGINSASDMESCIKACDEAFAYDDKILVEKGLNAREIECAALGGYDPDISLPGEVESHDGFYSYDAKYTDPNASTITVPADLPAAQIKEVQILAKKSFVALELYGMARLDFFLCRDSGSFYFNEANTIPGFTEISQYPQLWKHSGLSEKELISRLIELAVDRKKLKDRLKRNRV